ncbi:HAD family hydrolase [Sinomonas sp. ASV486]|uniref:HAD family hydrolase n=1 Tax=Sinomonas sp. ASV486 TaxID=3051170 RepID=UPI0027DD8F3E|nr:HAD family hydrolase [Sinomonas sp. ASV486]MDQ4490649.1 HAD family hydrolase [Sinomonas sp. ASV486]
MADTVTATVAEALAESTGPATPATHDGGRAPAVVRVPGVVGTAQVEGVLLDIDETLVDLEGAMDRALREVSAPLLPGLVEAEWVTFCRIFTRGSDDIYERYMAHEITFAEQRVLRAERCLAHFGTGFASDAQAAQWLSEYETAQPSYVRAFDDVHPFLDALEAAGIAYGAVSNNVHDYQRAKLDVAGLERISVLVGIDAVGVAKPDPAIFREGLRRLGTAAEQTVYVGDNPAHDVVGAAGAGIRGIWLNRRSTVLDPAAALLVPEQVASLGEIPGILGLL